MTKRISYLICLIFIMVLFTGCRRHNMPDDFNISFQFGTTDTDLVTIDTYNQLITKGSNQAQRLSFKMSDDDKAAIYDRMTDDIIRGFSGEYHGPTSGTGENIKFSIKYTSRKHTDIISGDYTTWSYQKRDTSSLIDFEEYMIEYVKGTNEYKQLQLLES